MGRRLRGTRPCARAHRRARLRLRLRRAVVVDEDTLRCGVTSEIAAQIMENAFDFLDAPVKRLAARNIPIPGGFMEEHVLPQPKDIIAAVEAIMG